MGSRVKTWEVGIAAFANDVIGEAFVWGSTDCAALTFRALAIMRPDVDSTIDWDSLRTARDRLALEQPHQWFERIGGRGVTPLSFASTGDVILGELRELRLPAFHLIVGNHALTSSPAEGVFSVPVARLLARDDVDLWRLP